MWKAMEKKDLRRLALAVFFLFGTIGPLTMLMNTAILPGSWFMLVYLTVLCGAFSACIILFIRKPAILAVSLILIIGAIVASDQVEQLLFGRVEEARIVTANHLFTFTQQELDRIEVRRPLFGVIAIVLLSTGYGLFVVVVGEEIQKRARLETEVAVARTIQKSLQPPGEYKTTWCEAAGITVPATEVGGDYYDMVAVSENEVAIAIADVSGHGVGAGILSAMTKSALRTELHHTSSPPELLFNLNNAMYQVADKKTFVSFAYVLLDKRTMSARITTAGHPPIFHIKKSDSGIKEVRTPNLALAAQASTKYTEEKIQLEHGDILVLYTDGITEAMNDKGEQFGIDRLRELLSDTERPSAQTLSNSILASVRAFTIKKEFKDDATIVVVKLGA